MESHTRDFTHPLLNQEVTAIGGHYMFIKEERLDLFNREVLYFVGYATIDTSCCGVGGCGYAIVAGFVEHYHYKTDKDGHPISQVEPITDPQQQKELSARITATEMVTDIRFE